MLLIAKIILLSPLSTILAKIPAIFLGLHRTFHNVIMSVYQSHYICGKLPELHTFSLRDCPTEQPVFTPLAHERESILLMEKILRDDRLNNQNETCTNQTLTNQLEKLLEDKLNQQTEKLEKIISEKEAELEASLEECEARIADQIREAKKGLTNSHPAE